MSSLSSLSRWLCWLPLLAAAPPMPEQIAVSDRYLTALVFAHEVLEVSLSSDAYAAQIKGKYVLLRSRRAGALATSLFVTHAGGFLHTKLSFSADSPKTYDLRGMEEETEEEGKEQPVADSMLRCMDYLSREPQRYKDIGLRQERMRVVLSSVLTDAAHTYLQLFVRNDSCIDYDIKEVLFCFQRGKKKKVYLSPVLASEQRWIAGYHEEQLIYVLPSYGLSAKGELVISFEEERGERSLQLRVPSEVLLSAPRYKEGPAKANRKRASKR